MVIFYLFIDLLLYVVYFKGSAVSSLSIPVALRVE